MDALCVDLEKHGLDFTLGIAFAEQKPASTCHFTIPITFVDWRKKIYSGSPALTFAKLLFRWVLDKVFQYTTKPGDVLRLYRIYIHPVIYADIANAARRDDICTTRPDVHAWQYADW